MRPLEKYKFSLSLNNIINPIIYIYIYIEMIDCGESYSMIEIWGKLNKSNT